jgi:hypothetical protein
MESRMPPPGRAILALLGVVAATAPLAGVAVHALAGPRAAASAGLGAALATASAAGSLVLLAWAMPRSQNVFLGVLVGGILARMVLFGGAVAILVVATKLPPAGFVGGLLCYYVALQALEIRSFHRWAGTEANQGR